jgi:hypothetical protein
VNSKSWEQFPTGTYDKGRLDGSLLAQPALPNILREIFAQSQYTREAIVIDACLALGIPSGEWFTLEELWQRLSGVGFSYNLLRDALGNHRIFKIGVLRNGRAGRDPHTYQIPSVSRLFAEWVNPAKWYRAVTDVLPIQALQSPKMYLAHLHKALIHRTFTDHDSRPVSLTRGFMASRLGVTTKTLRNYEKLFPQIHVTQVFEYTELIVGGDWELPAERDPSNGGTFLYAFDDEGNERHAPAIRAVAAQLVRDGWTVYRMTQKPNLYQIVTPYNAHLLQNRQLIPSSEQMRTDKAHHGT